MQSNVCLDAFSSPAISVWVIRIREWSNFSVLISEIDAAWSIRYKTCCQPWDDLGLFPLNNVLETMLTCLI